MLLLNAGLFLNLRLISFNLNTSYVTVKLTHKCRCQPVVDYLNTSKKSYIINNLLEAILTIVFVLVFWFVNNIIGFILYFLLFVMMVLINGKSYIKCIDMLKK